MIHRDAQRIKQTGEIFTPIPLVDEMLGKLPKEVWAVDKTFIDPACGDGNFLVRVVAWKIWKGSLVEQALGTTYGVDIMPDNIEHARLRVLIHAYVARRVLIREYKEKRPLNSRNALCPELSSDEEQVVHSSPTFAAFRITHEQTVQTNIVCHDALTYDYEFR